MLVFSVCVNAQAVSDSSQEEVIYANPEEVIDYPANPPELLADSIVIYVPDKDMSLHIMEPTERIIEGHVIKVEKGVELCGNRFVTGSQTFCWFTATKRVGRGYKPRPAQLRLYVNLRLIQVIKCLNFTFW